ncbi:MAG: CHC2 zinc finger domain-containing protein [Nostoc sp.]|uniref:CHC2 zinc finger domain-containing protein n=1 Tax=Nostoc sp. TaxID=1180 RepID=UPI002FFA36F7
MNKELLQKIHSIANTDIHNIVSKYVNLTPRDRDYHGDCPFCKEVGRFAIAPSKGMFYCFSCARGGGSVMFLGLIQDKPLDEVVKDLSETYSIC